LFSKSDSIFQLRKVMGAIIQTHYSLCILHFKNTKSESILLDSRALWGRMNTPPLLNTRSTGALVACTASAFTATSCSLGRFADCCAQNSKHGSRARQPLSHNSKIWQGWRKKGECNNSENALFYVSIRHEETHHCVITVLSESKSEFGVRVRVRVLKIRTRVRLEYSAGLEYYITGKNETKNATWAPGGVPHCQERCVYSSAQLRLCTVKFS